MTIPLRIYSDQLGIGARLANEMQHVNDRAAFVQNFRDKGFTLAGSRYNVMVFSAGQPHVPSLLGVKLQADTTLPFGSVIPWPLTYKIWIFEEGDFLNQGDGGYINWGFKGWFDQNGGYVRFRNPYAVQEAAQPAPQDAQVFEQSEEIVPAERLAQPPTP
jgi:hypothetical protein